MEVVRKKICFDKLLSHRNGIVPYILKDNEDTSINYVNTISSQSNYNSFPCDFALIDSHVVFDKETGLSYRENIEVSRLRYLDVISWYNDCDDIVKNGIILKKIPYDEVDVTHIECLENDRVITTNINNTFAWVATEDEVSIYDCNFVDISFLKKRNDKFYLFDKENTFRYEELKRIYGENFENIENATDEEKLFIEKYNLLVGENSDGLMFSNYIFASTDYDKYFKVENRWTSWWEDNWALCSFSSEFDRWERCVLDYEYNEPLSLKFIYDVEKYLLGKVIVPEKYAGIEITGTKVPNYVFYLNYMDYLIWFSDNFPYLDTNDTIKKEWERRGGTAFKNFLYSVAPKFFNEINEPVNGDVVYFNFVVPNLEFEVSFIDEFNNEYTYVPYEYSIVDDNVANGTREYVKGYGGMIESALTPTFKEFDNEIFVESRLNSLFDSNVYYLEDDVYGIFDNFSEGGCLFKCTFYTGETTANVQKFFSGCVKCYAKMEDDTWNEIKTVTIPEQYVETLNGGSMPKTKTNAYQVVGITEIDSSCTIGSVSTVDKPPVFDDDGNLKIVSSITTYNKSIKKTYSWCECVKEINTSNFTCGDGENINFMDSNKYRNILILGCVPSISETSEYGDCYYYMAKYDNGYTNVGQNKAIDKKTAYVKSLKLPFTVGEAKNVESYSGEFSNIVKYDMVLSEEFNEESGTVIINYVLGARVGDDVNTSGIHYRDEYLYGGNVFVDSVIDCVYDAKVLYEKISLGVESVAYSEEYNAYRNYKSSVITGMEIGTQWTNESAIKTYLFTDDKYDNLIEYPKIDVDISFNRGNAAAWEKHFKLSECNTFEDLENYGNHFFNI